ncbi:MAG: MBL fold metallo-hydrolase [Porphyromonadaceae bacterium]|jgi:phosphoribosyl 1,2-cyclic phosphodiesterase|nr:MBL fold metallo-hydrolase [Porphyromonadaceae bacterium]
MDRLRFRSLASGSSGNCYFIGNASYGILIDAGVGVRTIRKFLKSMGMDFNRIWGVFVTHDHIDHIKAVGTIGEKFHVPIYSTQKIHEGIERSYRVTQKLSLSKEIFNIGEQIQIGDFTVQSFPVSHDASEAVGYSIQYKGKKFTIATDLGYVSEEVASYLTDSDYIILESNYDEEMLTKGPYPRVLQQRIKADTGHLCNTQTASFLADYFTEKWKYVFLCHLSKENNLPELAFMTIKEHLNSRMIDFEEQMEIIPLNRMEPSAMYVFEH